KGVLMRLRTFSITDYIAAITLMALPYLFGFNDIYVARNVFFFFGIALLINSLFTKYQYSLSKIIPMGIHMAINFVLAIGIYFAPYWLGYRSALTPSQVLIHIGAGLFLITMISFSRVKTENDKLTTLNG